MKCPECGDGAIGTVDMVPGWALFNVLDDGVEWSGETKMFWDRQYSLGEPGYPLLQCHNRHEWPATEFDALHECGNDTNTSLIGPEPQRVWFDFGNGPGLHEEPTTERMAAFIEGITIAMQECGIDDYSQYDTEAEAIQNGWKTPEEI